MSEDAEDIFESPHWNHQRIAYEDAVVESVMDLSSFMGCNSFSLLDDDYTITVKVTNASTD